MWVKSASDPVIVPNNTDSRWSAFESLHARDRPLFGGKMNVLLINPWVYENDIIRANRIVKQYSKDYLHEKRPRHNAVIYTNEDYSSPVAVWHSKKQITLHFGAPRDQEFSR